MSCGHFATFLYASLVTIGIVVFVNISQPYILVEKLGVLAGAEGALTGQLSVVSELTVMLSIGLVGIMADRIGRKQIFALGLIIFGVFYLLYPLSRQSPNCLRFASFMHWVWPVRRGCSVPS